MFFREPVRMKSWVAYSLCLLITVGIFVESSALPQTGNGESTTAKDKTIIIREHGKDHVYDFEDDLLLFGIDQVKLVFQNRVNGKLYRLMYVIGPSGGGGNGQCGAGQEEYLIWQVLDSKWAQDDYKVELIASCAVSIENRSSGSSSYEVSKGKLTSEYNDYRDNMTNTLTYDSAKPEKAWTIQRKPLPAGPN
jgi:hypothetical protein